MLNLYGAQTVPFRISYNSLLTNEGPLGNGWNHNFETRLELLTDGSINVAWNANRKNRFFETAVNTFTSYDLPTKNDQLLRNGDGTYTLTRNDQTVYKFNSSGQLTEQHNGHGQYLTMTRDGTGRLTGINEPLSGRSITIAYNVDGLIETISETGLNRTVSLDYSLDRNLYQITDAESQITTYTYYVDDKIESATDHEANQIFYNTYDANGRVETQDDARTDNQLTTFTYDNSSDPGKMITTVTDRNGQVREYTHDSDYRLLSIKDELGNMISRYTYDTFAFRSSVTDALNTITTFVFDARGNMLSSTDPNGGITGMTYDTKNNLLTIENPMGKQTTFTYDGNNNITSLQDALNNTKTFTYNTNGLLTGITAPGTGIITYTYVNGQVETYTDPNNNVTTYGYDAAGRLITVTNAAGKTTTTAYDEVDNPLSVTDHLQNFYSMTYNSNRDTLTLTDARGKVTQYQYSGNGKLTKVIDAALNETLYAYDGEDRLIYLTDANNHVTTYGYDVKGRLTSITDPLNKTVTLQYDALDRLTGKIDALNNQVLTITYDALGNPVTITDGLNRTVTNTYDNLGRLEQVADPAGSVTQYYYDDLDRVISAIDPRLDRSTQVFDVDGNRTKLVDPNTNVTSFTLDQAGLLEQITPAIGGTVSYNYNSRNLVEQLTNGRSQVTDFLYDDAGRLSSFTDPTGTVSYTYDANGSILTVTDSTGTISRQYDDLNQVIEYTDAQGNVIQYGYDNVGNLTTLTYPGGRQVQYGYDAANRLIQVTDWAGRITSYEYDANGRLTKTTRPNGSVLTQTYDTAGQLLQYKDVDHNGSIINQYDFTYDDLGNVITEASSITEQPFTIPNPPLTYTTGNRLGTFNGSNVIYDADGNMVTGPLKGVMSNFGYDSRNRLTGAGNLTYTYDAENNRIAVTDSLNGTTGYVINPNSVLSQVLIKTDPLGNKTYYVYGLGLIGQEDPDGTYRTYHFDRRGSTVAFTNQAGTITDRYQYTPYGELVYQSGTTSTPFLFNGRYGVMTDDNGLYYMRARYYNPEIKRFINQDIMLGDVHSGQSQNRYAYANGNPVSYLDPFGLSRDSDGMLDNFQTMLDFAGMVPGIGEAFDGLNALIYFGRGDYTNASISLASMTGVGEAAKIGKMAAKFGLDAGVVVGFGFMKRAYKAESNGNFIGVKNLDDFRTRVPSKAIELPWREVPGGAKEGVKFKWTDKQGIKWSARAHGIDPAAPAGSNASKGWIYRVEVDSPSGKWYMDSQGIFHKSNVLNERSPFYRECIANDTHIPFR